MKKSADKPKIIVVCGPTGSGKTSLAALLCKKFNGEIVNADSRQVYKYMDIGTAKGEIKNQKSKIKILESRMAGHTIEGVPIWLVDIVEPNDRYSVGRFKKDAESAIADIIGRGKLPFVVGGTGLYIDALVENFQIPMTNVQSNLKSKISKIQFKNKNLEDLVKLLKKVDPRALKAVDLKNRRRVERALEYCLSTGKKFSNSRKKGEGMYDVLKLSPKTSLNREELYEKINKRVDEMIEQGLEKEVQRLVKKYGWESEAMTGIGYREWRVRHSNTKSQIPNPKQILNPKFQISKDTESVIEQIKKDTRNYAKRQMTWFKRDEKIQYIDLKEAEKLVKTFLG